MIHTSLFDLFKKALISHKEDGRENVTVESEFVFFQFVSRFFNLSELLGALPFFVSAKREAEGLFIV